MSKKLFSKIFVFLLVVGLLFAVAPTRQALAQTPTTLNVADWSETASVGVTGRPSVLLDGTTYHLWYGPTDTSSQSYRNGWIKVNQFDSSIIGTELPMND